MTLHFKNKNAYLKWLAFKYMHLGKAKSKQKVTVAGKSHKVCHSDVCEAQKIKEAKQKR